MNANITLTAKQVRDACIQYIQGNTNISAADMKDPHTYLHVHGGKVTGATVVFKPQ